MQNRFNKQLPCHTFVKLGIQSVSDSRVIGSLGHHIFVLQCHHVGFCIVLHWHHVWFCNVLHCHPVCFCFVLHCHHIWFSIVLNCQHVCSVSSNMTLSLCMILKYARLPSCMLLFGLTLSSCMGLYCLALSSCLVLHCHHVWLWIILHCHHALFLWPYEVLYGCPTTEDTLLFLIPHHCFYDNFNDTKSGTVPTRHFIKLIRKSENETDLKIPEKWKVNKW